MKFLYVLMLFQLGLIAIDLLNDLFKMLTWDFVILGIIVAIIVGIHKHRKTK